MHILIVCAYFFYLNISIIELKLKFYWIKKWNEKKM